jgi:hypothetical protein
MFFSLINLITVNDYYYKKRFLSYEAESFSFKNSCKFIFQGTEFLTQAVALAVIILLMPYRTLFFDIAYGFSKLSVVPSIVIKLILVIFATSLTFFINYLAVEWWVGQKLKKKLSFTWKNTIRSIVKQAIIIIAAYLFTASALAVVYPMLCTVYNIFSLNWTASATVIFLIVFAILSYRHIRAIVRRMQLMRALKKECRESGYKLANEKKIYISVFRPSDGINFVIKKNGKVYSCKLICALKYRTPIYFNDDGNLYYTKSYGAFGVDIFHVSTYYKYFFDGEGEKILIVCPVSAYVYASDGNFKRKLEAGDKINGYKMYNSTSFVNAIRRDGLGR